MNIKLHTPKSLKAGSGMASTKQFLLSLLATTVSIALTFGTAAIVDNSKKKKEKHEIVMMVMYDMYKSISEVEESDSMIRQSMDLQRQLAEDPTRFQEIKEEIALNLPISGYTETIEHIISSNIETINTVGNLLFTENVADFYQIRRRYKTEVCDSLLKEYRMIFDDLNAVLNCKLFNYAVITSGALYDMKHLFSQCKQMMDVTDEELAVYRKERIQIEEEDSTSVENRLLFIKDVREIQNRIDSAKAKLILK